MAEEELSLLAEIFCFPGELVHWRSGDAIHVNVKISEPCAQMGSHDLILSIGSKKSCKYMQSHVETYLVQHKTACVDVDSRGHSCKERMMTVLTEEPYTATVKEGKNMGFSDFQAVECSNMAEVENIFKTYMLHYFCHSLSVCLVNTPPPLF
ncbi:unnamed protein product [Acanthosepion pharaonis]|uniref:Uncharacterized protein n=1 Tax=Acanthosepion pharaonis TaxID=158019 RepID=A0A812AUI3_ACAPH|nr:unnamed protein product [Sepia pharaonis]